MSKLSRVWALALIVLLALASPVQASGSYTWTWNGWQYTITGDTGSESYTSFTYYSQYGGILNTVSRNGISHTAYYNESKTADRTSYTGYIWDGSAGSANFSAVKVSTSSDSTPSNSNANANSATVTTQETTRVAGQLTTNLISTRISTILSPSPLSFGQGGSGGGGFSPGGSGGGFAPSGGTGGSGGSGGGTGGGTGGGGSAPGSGGGTGSGQPSSDSGGGMEKILASAMPDGRPGVVLDPASPRKRDGLASPGQDLRSLFAAHGQQQLGAFNEKSLAAHFNKAQDTGLAAGDDPPKYGLWGVGTYANMQDFQTNTRYEGNMYMFMGGFDYKLTEQFVIGAAAGYENAYLDTAFNQGNVGTDGYTFAPYAAYKITDTLTVDALGGITFLNYDTKRSDIGGHYQAVRNMWSVNLNKYFLWDNWIFAATVGNMFVNEHAESFAESDGTSNGGRENYLSELRLGGKASYVFGKFEAYGGLAYLLDYMMRYTGTMPDNDSFEGTLGLNYRPVGNWMLGLEGASTFDRSHTQNNRVMANIRYEF